MPNMTFAQALNDAHKIEMARDPNIYVAGEDVGVYGGIFGVTAGLLLTKQPFGFMALLGFMSLSGMLIKNAVVLIDEIELQKRSDKSLFDAIVDSGMSRLRPVSMAALTTALGLIPLLLDAFFVSMAVTIIFGLMVATVLTMVVVPVLYAIFFRVPYPRV